MAMKIVMTVCMLPVLPMMFGACWFLESEKNGTQFGITLWNGAREQSEILEIKRIYKKELKRALLVCLLMFFLTLLPEHESLVITGMMVWTFFSIIYFMFPFQRANKRMKEQKQKYFASLPESEIQKREDEILIDVTAAGADKPQISKKSLYAGCVFTLLAPIAELFLYCLWPCPWLPELWICEVILISVAGAAWCFPLYLKFYEKQRTKVFTYNSQVNLQVAEIRKYYWGRLCTLLVWLTGVFNWGILASFYVPVQWFPWLMGVVSLVFGMASIGVIFYYWKRMDETSKKYLAQECLAQEDDDKYWIWGMFYYNKSDSRIMVEQRAGIGMTCNMAKPGIKCAFILLWIAIIGGTFGACGWSILEEFTPVTLYYEDGTLIAKHWKKVYQINQEDMEQIVLLEEEPEIRRQSGTGMKTVKKGNFYSDTYRRDFKVCLNPKEPPFLMIESADGKWYLLGSSDEKITRDILNKIQP